MLFLRLLHDDGREEVFPLGPGRTRLGRTADNDVVLPDLGASRYHAELVVAGGRVVVRDVGSRNGTLLVSGPGRGGDERQVLLRAGTAEDEADLAPGDEIRLGSVRLRLGESLAGGLPGGVVAAADGAGGATPGVDLAAAGERETLDLSGSRAVELLDFLARFAQTLAGAPSPGRLLDGLSRLRALARAERVEVLRARDGEVTVELAAGATAGAGAMPSAAAAPALVAAVLAARPPRSRWWDGGPGERTQPALLVTPLAEDAALCLVYAATAPRPSAEELRSLEVAASIAGQSLRLAAAVEQLERANRALGTQAAGWRRAAEPGMLLPLDTVASSPALRQVLDEARLAAPTRQPVLLTGPTGVGKEMVARFLHRNSPRREAQLVAVNCAALGDELFLSEMFGHRRGAFTGAVADKAGLVEIAAGGTLLLDEVGELTPLGQARLLRLLEERTYRRVGEEQERAADVRVVAATNRDLRAAAASGAFRADLLFRLDVVAIDIPALARRPEDILPLARLFLRRSAEELGRPPLDLDVEASRLLHAWSWPGNVRELRNVIDRAAILARGSLVTAAELRFAPGSSPPEGLTAILAQGREEALEAFKRLYFERLLLACDWNVSRAARAAAMERRNLQQVIARYGLTRPPLRASPPPERS